MLEDTEVHGEFARLVMTDPKRTISVEGATIEGMVNGELDGDGIKRARVKGKVTTNAPTVIDLPLAQGAADANVRLKPGTSIEVDTKDMIRDPDGNLVSTPDARVKAHIALESGTVDYKSLISAGFVGDGTIDLDAALGLKIDPKKLVGGDGTPVVGPVPLDLKMDVGFAPNSKLFFKPPGAKDGEGSEIEFGGNTQVQLDVKGEVDPETGKPSLKGINGANVKFKGAPIDTKKLRELAESGVMIDQMLGNKFLKDAKVEFTPDGMVIKTKNGGELKILPNEIGLRRGKTR